MFCLILFTSCLPGISALAVNVFQIFELYIRLRRQFNHLLKAEYISYADRQESDILLTRVTEQNCHVSLTHFMFVNLMYAM